MELCRAVSITENLIVSPTLVDFVLASRQDTVAPFKEHFKGLYSELGRYFPESDTSFEWIRNPFGDKTHIKHVSSKLPPREVDSLVGIASDGTLRERFDRLFGPLPT